MKKFVPLHDRILVKREETSEKTKGGIYIPEDAREVKQACRVLAVGPDAQSVKVGDTVFVSKYAGTDIWLEREKLLVVSDDEILGLIEEE